MTIAVRRDHNSPRQKNTTIWLKYIAITIKGKYIIQGFNGI